MAAILSAHPIDSVLICAEQIDQDVNAIADSSTVSKAWGDQQPLTDEDYMNYIPYDIIFTQDRDISSYLENYLANLKKSEEIHVPSKYTNPRIMVLIQYRNGSITRMAFCSNHLTLVNMKYYVTDKALLDQIIPFLSEGSQKVIKQTDLY